MPTWLNSQKKARLAELALMCNMGTQADLAEWRKDQLVPALENILSANPHQFSKNPAFDEYYARRNSPIKRGSSANVPIIPSNGELLARSRRATEILKAESDGGEEPSSSPNLNLSSPSITAASIRRTVPTVVAPTVVAPTAIPTLAPSRTPSRVVQDDSFAHPAPLPPSPAIVTDLIEAQTARFNAEVGEIWASTRFVEFLQQIRLEMSSMAGVHMMILLLESSTLHWSTVPWVYAFDIGSPFHTSVYVPDLFVLFTGYYLSLLSLWLSITFIIPLAVSWFCNLSLKLKSRNGVDYWRPRYRVDPLTFNITKALLTWLVFEQGHRFLGLFAPETVARLDAVMPAGSTGMMISAGIGMILSIWDGLQGKKGWS